MKKHIITCLYLSLFVAACAQPSTLTPNPNTNPTVLLQSTNTPSRVDTSTPSPSPTIVPASILVENCLEISPLIPSDLKTHGVIALATGNNTDFTLLDLATGKKSRIGGGQNAFVINLLVSPGGNKFAYLLDSKGKSPQVNELVISTLDGQKGTIPWQNGWISWNWLDNDRLIIGKADNRFGSYIVVDSNSGQIEEDIPLQFINDNSIFPTVYHYLNQKNQSIETSFAELFFDPTLTRVIHFGYNTDKVNYERTLLRDLGDGKVLADLPNILNIPDFSASEVSYPVWAPDGKSFLIEASDSAEARDLYQVSRDGEITRLTYFTNTSERVRIQNYSFSPDQRYIAFWLLTDRYEEYHLAVLDTSTKEIFDTCIPAFANNSLYVPFSPFWAPDSHQFVIETNQTEELSTTVLIDLDHYLAAQVSENMLPRGWLVNP